MQMQINKQIAIEESFGV